MSTYAAALELVAKLEPQLPPDTTATADPRSATPPCLLVAHSDLRYTTMCGGDVTWQIVALAPGPFNADAWQSLDALAAVVRAVLDVESYRVVAYRLALDSPLLPAYLFTSTAAIDLGG